MSVAAAAPPVLLSPLASRDEATALADLFARTLGTGWFPAASVAGYVNAEHADRPPSAGPPRFGRIARLSPGGNTGLVGGLLAEVVSPNALTATFLNGYDFVKNNARVVRLQSGQAGLIRAIAVEEHARGRGVATRLVEDATSELARRGAAGFYAFAWTSEAKGCHLGGVLERAGFSPVRCFSEAFREFSLRHNCHCPYCGQPCRCDAWLYVRV